MGNTESLRRERQIIKTSAVGIVVNVLLSAFKAAVGLISGSIAIVLDAVNNLSDALSSIVTIIGMLLAGKPADAGHPFGHGRIEYLSALLVACIVIMAGVMSFVESIKKIIHPQPAEYTYVALIIIGSAIITKYFLGHYFKKVGQQEKPKR